MSAQLTAKAEKWICIGWTSYVQKEFLQGKKKHRNVESELFWEGEQHQFFWGRVGGKWVFQGRIWNKQFKNQRFDWKYSISVSQLKKKKRRKNKMMAGVEMSLCHVCFYSIPKKKKKKGIWHFKAKQRKKNCHFESVPDFSGKADSFLIEKTISKEFSAEILWTKTLNFFPKEFLEKRRHCNLGIGCCIGTALMCLIWYSAANELFFHSHTKKKMECTIILLLKYSTSLHR